MIDEKEITDLWLAPWGQGAVVAAIQLKIFDCLADREMSLSDLADDLKLNPDKLDSVLRVLRSYGLIKVDNSLLKLTDIANHYLTTENDFSKTHQFEEYADYPQVQFIIKKLTYAEEKDKGFGDDWSQEAGEHELASKVALGMNSLSKAPASYFSKNEVFKKVNNVLDVGGGSASFSIALVKANSHMKATVLDLPTMCYQAKKFIKESKVENVSTYEADFFKDEWPSGYDAILMSNILHDWPIEKVNLLLKSSYLKLDEIDGDKYLFLMEALLEGNGYQPRANAIFNMQMNLAYSGQQFSKTQLFTLLGEHKFSETEIVGQFGYYSLIRAKVN